MQHWNVVSGNLHPGCFAEVKHNLDVEDGPKHKEHTKGEKKTPNSFENRNRKVGYQKKKKSL